MLSRTRRHGPNQEPNRTRRRQFPLGVIPGTFDPFDSSYPTAVVGAFAEDPLWANPGDGNAVTSWRDGTGGGRHFTGANHPTFRSSVAAYGNRPALDLSGGTFFGLLSGTFSAVSLPMTVVCVANLAPTSTTNQIFGGGDSGTTLRFGATSGNVLNWNNGTNRTAGTSSTSPSVWVVEFRSNGVQAIRNAGTPTTQSEAGSNTVTSLWAGRSFNGNGTAGHISFIALYASAITAGITELADDLQDLYGF
jgi:hypothetical protein